MPGSRINCVAFHPQGKLAFSGANDGVRVWDVEDRKEVAHFLPRVKSMGQLADDVLAVAVVGDGSQLLIGGWWPKLFIWDYENNSVATEHDLPLIDGNVGPVSSIAISPDGQLAAVAVNFLRPDVSDESFRMLLLDTRTWKQVRWITGHRSPIIDVAFTPDGKRVLSLSNRTLRLWEVESGTELLREGDLPSNKSFGRINRGSLAIDETGKYALQTGERSQRPVVLWDIENWSIQQTFIPKKRGWSRDAEFIPHSDRLVAAHEDGTLRIWKRLAGEEICRAYAFRTKAPAFALAVSPDGKYLLSAGDGDVSNFFTRTDSAKMRLWRLPEP